MMRLLLIIGLFFGFIWVAKRLFRYFLARWLLSLQQSSPLNVNTVQDVSEKLVQCQHCHTFIPKAKAVESAQRYYCSQEHATL